MATTLQAADTEHAPVRRYQRAESGLRINHTTQRCDRTRGASTGDVDSHPAAQIAAWQPTERRYAEQVAITTLPARTYCSAAMTTSART
jgi:hypothetical protein